MTEQVCYFVYTVCVQAVAHLRWGGGGWLGAMSPIQTMPPPPTMPPSPHLTFDCAPFIAMSSSWSPLDEGLHPLPPPPPNKDSVMPLYSDQVRRENKGGTACPGGYKGVRAVRPESVAGGGWFWGVMEFGMSRRIKPKEKYVSISRKENLAQFGRCVEK